MKINTLIRTFWLIYKGYRVASKLIQANPGRKMVFTTVGLGDMALMLAYTQHFKRYNGINDLHVVTARSSKDDIFLLFKGQCDDVIQISESDLNALKIFYQSDVGLLFREKHSEIIAVFPTCTVRNDILRNNPYVNYKMLVKAIFRIPQSCMPCNLNIENCGNWLNSLKDRGILDPDNTIVINPYANTVDELPMHFWERLIAAIKEQGYKVIISSKNGNHSFENNYSDSLEFPISKMIPLINVAGIVIGQRSGFMDLACFSDAVIICIEPEGWIYSDYYRLETNWDNSRVIRTVFYKDKECEDSTVSEVLRCVSALKSVER